jgi:hypothetical protein
MAKETHCSVGNPHDADDDVHALGLTALVLVVPDAVLLGVPVCASGRVHSTATNGGGRGSCSSIGSSRARVGQVLDDGGVYGELVLDLALRFGDEGGQDGFLCRACQGVSDVMFESARHTMISEFHCSVWAWLYVVALLNALLQA